MQQQTGGAFGQQQQPAFGAPKPFSFGSPTQPGLFGTATTPAPFGAPAATPAFGSTTFGASTPGFSLASAATPAPATSPGLLSTPGTPLFGVTTPAFGQSSTPALGSFTGFSFATAAASPAPSPFGVMTSPAVQQPGMFGQQTQLAPVGFGAAAPPDAAIKEILEIRGAYTPSSSTYKFQHLFLNVIDNPAQRVKPPNVDEIRWRQVLAQAGGASNPDKLWPVMALGFKDLLLRAAAQSSAIDENQQRLKSLTEMSHRMSRQHMAELKRRTGDVQRRHIELSNRLLRVTRLLDALDSRLASSLGYQGDLSQGKEQELSRQLAAVEAEVSPSSYSGLQRRLEAVASAARLRSREAAGSGRAAGPAAKLDDKSLQQLFAVLKEHAEGVKQLQEVLKRDQMDVQIMKQQQQQQQQRPG